MPLAPIIQIRNLRKVYRIGSEKVVALNSINLDIEEGQICCILGTSGSGKSTLLNQLAGLEKPTKGKVLLGGVNISVMNERQLAEFRKKNVGFVFQSYNLMPGMSALDNVAMPLMFRGVDRKTRNRLALKMLGQVGLKSRAGHRPTQMSGGQQQRVGIARAFVSKPRIIFADEPTGNLDTKTTIEVMELMVRLARRSKETLVLVTHDMELADYADRIVTIVDGNVVGDRINTPKYVPTEEELFPKKKDKKGKKKKDSEDENPDTSPDEETIPDEEGFTFSHEEGEGELEFMEISQEEEDAPEDQPEEAALSSGEDEPSKQSSPEDPPDLKEKTKEEK